MVLTCEIVRQITNLRNDYASFRRLKYWAFCQCAKDGKVIDRIGHFDLRLSYFMVGRHCYKKDYYESAFQCYYKTMKTKLKALARERLAYKLVTSWFRTHSLCREGEKKCSLPLTGANGWRRCSAIEHSDVDVSNGSAQFLPTYTIELDDCPKFYHFVSPLMTTGNRLWPMIGWDMLKQLLAQIFSAHKPRECVSQMKIMPQRSPFCLSSKNWRVPEGESKFEKATMTPSLCNVG